MKFKVQVIRTYSILDIIEVDADTIKDAEELALTESGNKDYTGMYSLEDSEATCLICEE